MKLFCRPSVQSFEDVEGLLTNAGIIGALLFGLACSVFPSISREDLYAPLGSPDFVRTCLSDSKPFRDYVVNGIVTAGIADFPNFTYPDGRVLDTKAILLSVGKKPLALTMDAMAEVEVKEPVDGATDFWVAVETVLPLITDQSVMTYLAYNHEFVDGFRHNRDPDCPPSVKRVGSMQGHNNAYNLLWFGTLCIILLMLSVLGSLVLYFSLTLTDLRETQGTEVGKEKMRRWNSVGRWGIALIYLLMVFGIIFFSTGLTAVFENQFGPLGKDLYDVGFKAGLIPGCCLLILMSVAAAVRVTFMA